MVGVVSWGNLARSVVSRTIRGRPPTRSSGCAPCGTVAIKGYGETAPLPLCSATRTSPRSGQERRPSPAARKKAPLASNAITAAQAALDRIPAETARTSSPRLAESRAYRPAQHLMSARHRRLPGVRPRSALSRRKHQLHPAAVTVLLDILRPRLTRPFALPINVVPRRILSDI
jgi:hypothetical protein